MASHEILTRSQREDTIKEVSQFLTDKGLTQVQLAERAGVPQSFICNLLQGNFKMSTPRTRRLLKYIRIIRDGAASQAGGIPDAIEHYLAAGGEPSLLQLTIEMMTRAYQDALRVGGSGATA